MSEVRVSEACIQTSNQNAVTTNLDFKVPHLFLTGYRGTGKSTIGKLLADSLGRPAIDLDDVIVEQAGVPIRTIFEREGEPGFRQREANALQIVAAGPDAVIALGGGAILAPQNRQIINASGRCCWLTASPEEIASRLASDSKTSEQRPALTNLSEIDEIRTLIESRTPLYQDVADLEIATDHRSTTEIVREILTWWKPLNAV